MAESATEDGVPSYRGTPTPERLVEIARYFVSIGIVGFGGPLVHIAMMEDDLVGADGWTDRRTSTEGLTICNTLPGPASTQLGIFMGWVRGGTLGALVAGGAFMLPTFVLVVFFSWLYFAYRAVPSVEAFFYGINPVVIGLIVGFFPYFARVRENDVVQTALKGVNAAVVGAIVGATVTLARESFVDPLTVGIAAVTFVLFRRGIDVVYLIFGGGAVGIAAFFVL